MLEVDVFRLIINTSRPTLLVGHDKNIKQMWNKYCDIRKWDKQVFMTHDKTAG